MSLRKLGKYPTSCLGRVFKKFTSEIFNIRGHFPGTPKRGEVPHYNDAPAGDAHQTQTSVLGPEEGDCHPLQEAMEGFLKIHDRI